MAEKMPVQEMTIRLLLNEPITQERAIELARPLMDNKELVRAGVVEYREYEVEFDLPDAEEVAEEVRSLLDQIKAMGVNIIRTPVGSPRDW